MRELCNSLNVGGIKIAPSLCLVARQLYGKWAAAAVCNVRASVGWTYRVTSKAYGSMTPKVICLILIYQIVCKDKLIGWHTNLSYHMHQASVFDATFGKIQQPKLGCPPLLIRSQVEKAWKHPVSCVRGIESGPRFAWTP